MTKRSPLASSQRNFAMRAWLLDSLTGIERLRLTTVADPVPAPGRVILNLHIAALNPADRHLAENQYPARPALPHILGRDGVGTVSSVGPDVDQQLFGKKLAVLRCDVGVNEPGTFAEKVSVPTDALVEVPPGWTDEQCAGAALVYLTAYQALTQWPDLPPAPLTLVTGASGGVGVASIQLAKAMGHTVIALSRSQSKQKRLFEQGVDLAIDPTLPNWPKQLLTQTAGRRVDLAIDSIGGAQFPQIIAAMADQGRISCVGRAAGSVPEFNTATLFFRRLRLGGVSVGSFTRPQSQSAWTQIVKLMESRHAKPLVDQVFPFDELPQAFTRLAIGPLGKVLLKIS
jgi:NADPH:quinone reductase